MTLTALDLSIGYGRHTVGSGLSLTVGPAEIVCLLGPNGCGKTTLFKTLLGLLPPLGGDLRIDGHSITKLSRVQIARKVAYVPQAHTPPFPFEVLDVVLMGRTASIGLFAQPATRDRKTALAAMDRLGIADLARKDYARLSGGQRQLVLIARALAQETPLIVMDEPTASLDFANRLAVLDQIARLTSTDWGSCGVILSTHDPDQAFGLSARVLAMSAGRMLADGQVADVLTPSLLSRLYNVPLTVETTGSGRRICVPLDPRAKIDA